MAVGPTAHPSPADLRAFGQGRLSPEEAAAVEGHLAGCDACGRLLEGAPLDSFVGQLRRARHLTPLAPAAAAPSPPPVAADVTSDGDAGATFTAGEVPGEL